MDASDNDLVPEELRRLYEIREWRHAIPILVNDFPSEWNDIIEVLSDFRFLKSEITAGGGRKSQISTKIDGAFYQRDWEERTFETTFSVDGVKRESRSHLIECAKSGVGLEIDWSSNDQTYVRDLNDFRVLFDLRVLDVGVIVTRCDHVREIFDELNTSWQYGASNLGDGGIIGCPIVILGRRFK